MSGRVTGAEATPPAGGMAEEEGVPDAVRVRLENQEEVGAGEVITPPARLRRGHHGIGRCGEFDDLGLGTRLHGVRIEN